MHRGALRSTAPCHTAQRRPGLSGTQAYASSARKPLGLPPIHNITYIRRAPCHRRRRTGPYGSRQWPIELQSAEAGGVLCTFYNCRCNYQRSVQGLMSAPDMIGPDGSTCCVRPARVQALRSFRRCTTPARTHNRAPIPASRSDHSPPLRSRPMRATGSQPQSGRATASHSLGPRARLPQHEYEYEDCARAGCHHHHHHPTTAASDNCRNLAQKKPTLSRVGWQMRSHIACGTSEPQGEVGGGRARDHTFRAFQTFYRAPQEDRHEKRGALPAAARNGGRNAPPQCGFPICQSQSRRTEAGNTMHCLGWDYSVR